MHCCPVPTASLLQVLAAVIPRRTREQLMLFTRKQREAAAEALLQWVPAEQLPERYGGKCAVPLGESDLEKNMAAYVAALNTRAASCSGNPGAALAAGGLTESSAVPAASAAKAATALVD